MERVDIGDWCTLYCANSTHPTVIDILGDHMIDAVIADPPYGISMGSVGESLTIRGLNAAPDDRPAALRGYPEIHGDKTGADVRAWVDFAPDVVIWGAEHLRRYLPAEGGRFLAWDKLAGRAPWDTFGDVEFAWHNRKGAPRIISWLWKGAICEKTSADENGVRHHPMQKPVRVMEWCIDQCRLKPGALILDPYMGSGTTAIAAFKRRMKFIGCEIDRLWFDVAVERINRQTGDGPLFEPAPVEQIAMAV